MSGPLVGAARVEIEGDLGKFATETKQKIGQALGQTGAEVDGEFKKIEGEVEQSGAKAGTGWASKAGDKIKAGLGHVKSAAGGILGDLGIGATLAAGIGSALSTMGNRGALAAKLGLSDSDAKKYGDIAGHIYAGAWGDSLGDVSDAIAAVKRGLGDVNDADLEGITTQALAFQQAFGYETADSIRAVSNMLKTGLVSSAQEAFDVLTAGEQAGTDKAGDLMDTFNEYSVQFAKFGLSGADALGLLQQGLQGGARDSDLVADSMKEFSLRAVDGSTTTAAAFKGLGLDATKMSHLIAAGGESGKAGLQGTLDALRAVQDPVKRAQLAAALFGSQAEDLGSALFELNPATASAAKGLGQVTGAGAKMTENMGKTTPPLEALKRSAMGTFSELAAKAIPVLTPILGLMTKLGPVIVGVGLALGGMMVITKVAGVLSSFGQLLAPMAVRMGIMTAATEAETVAQTGLNLAFLANPIVLIIAGLVALGVAFAVLWNKSETFRHIVTGAFDAVKDAGVAVWHFIQAAWNNVGKPVIDFIGSHWKLILGAMTGGLTLLITNWRDIWGFIKSVWNNVGKPVIGAIGDAFGWVGDRFHDLWVLIKRIGGWIGDAWRAMGSALKSVWDHTIGWAFGKITGGFAALQKAVERIASAIGRAWNRMVGPLMDVWDKISGIFNDIAGAYQTTMDLITGGTFVSGVKDTGKWNFPTTQGSGTPRHNARGGDVPLGWSTAGEEGIEYIYNSGSRQTVYTKDSTNNMGDKTGISSGLSTEQFEALMDALLGRPQVHYLVLPDKRVIAVASEEGQMLMDRAR